MRLFVKDWKFWALSVMLLVPFTSMQAAKVSCLKTDNGQYIELARVSMMVVADGGDTFEIVVTSGEGATGVKRISFEWHETSGIQSPAASETGELRLVTPASSQLEISGCGDAEKVVVYALDGRQVTEAPVANGHTIVGISHLESAVYILKVGSKSLKFTKR